MEFRIADTFTDSLARLTGDEQKAVKTTVFDLQMNPASPGMQFHKLDRAKDKKFWSVRVNRDIRIIVHKSDSSLLLCYVDHHDNAYQWAERRKLETHPKTGAAQLVEIRETIKEITLPRYFEVDVPMDRAAEKVASYGSAAKPLFDRMSEDELLGYGVPREWIADVRVATEATLFGIAEHLPHEASEALLEIATGGTPRVTAKPALKANPFEHPDAQRRFRTVANVEEMARALEYPWEKWMIFLHPAQRDLVERDYSGPARISGSAGTGKTIVALHRAVHLARKHPDARVLLTTFSETLARVLQTRLRRLAGNEPLIGERLEVHAIGTIGLRLHQSLIGKAAVASPEQIRTLLEAAAGEVAGHKFSKQFIWNEWNDIVDARQIKSWDAYKNVARLGRKTRLSEKQRGSLWSIFENALTGLSKAKLMTRSELFHRVAEKLSAATKPPFEFVVIDEAQDVSIAELRFLAALGGSRANGLFFTGDLGQRIFQQPFSWKAMGVDIRGRSSTLRINYRTSHQIRRRADRLLPTSLADVDGNTEGRKGTISVLEGVPPEVKVFDSEKAELDGVGRWLRVRLTEGLKPHEIGIFVRTQAQVVRAMDAAKTAKIPAILLDGDVETRSEHLSISVMHIAKGLEFRAVVVMACDDEVIPLQERIESVSDEADLEEVYSTERHLLYVACTRARDFLFVCGVQPASEFLSDINTN